MNEIKYNLLKNWYVKNAWDGSVILCGEVYNDAKQRFPDGTSIVTSRVKRIDFVEGIADTKNTRYILEPRRA